MTEGETAEVRPIYGANVNTKCLTCHKELVIRRPTKLEQIQALSFLRAKWGLDIYEPEDIYFIGEECECGQPIQAFFEIRKDDIGR